MKTFFVQQDSKKSFFKRIKKIGLEENKIIIYKDLKKIKVEKKENIVKRIKEILINEKCKQLVLSKDLKENQEFVNLLYGYNINICNEKWLFKQLTNEIIEKILEDEKKEKEQLHICINEIDNLSEHFIYKFAREFKNVTIVTKYIGKFKNIEEKLYQDEGILINITNNKRKSLRNAKLIINIDFPKEMINQFTIYDKSIIITWEDDTKILKKRFEGRIIKRIEYNIEIEKNNKIDKFIKENNLINYDKADICQALGIIPGVKNTFGDRGKKY